MKDLFDDLVEDISAELSVEEAVVTAQEIEYNIKRKRKVMEDSAKKSVALKKMTYRQSRLGRDVATTENHLKNTANRFKNTLKKR